jgi:hypothetical protein
MTACYSKADLCTQKVPKWIVSKNPSRERYVCASRSLGLYHINQYASCIYGLRQHFLCFTAKTDTQGNTTLPFSQFSFSSFHFSISFLSCSQISPRAMNFKWLVGTFSFHFLSPTEKCLNFKGKSLFVKYRTVLILMLFNNLKITRHNLRHKTPHSDSWWE